LSHKECLTLTRELNPVIPLLINLEFGNYVVQKLLDTGFKEIVFLVYISIDNIIATSKNKYGCRIVQAVLDTQMDEINTHILLSVMDHLYELSTDVYGNHVVQKLIKDVSKLAAVGTTTQNIEYSYLLFENFINIYYYLSINE